MNELSDRHNQWLDGARLPNVHFLMNDYVDVIAGQHLGELGSVVSIYQFEPTPCYVVETETGKDIVVAESEIQIANS
jgi:ribosomal protein L24